ncbi:nuclear transport factor 2 family protein [Microbacterium sp. 22242]|uniref:nuclear transport factor 2 family protein n=1 Tax=Microbacterium sp. 22242 TaxID=3453896 RepID=UPI003F8782F0
MRTTREVIEDHLSRRLEGDLDGDLRNYSPEVVRLTGSGVYRGLQGVRESSEELGRLVGDATLACTLMVTEGGYAYLEWTADNASTHVGDGADTFVLRDGLIVLQTTHCTIAGQSRGVAHAGAGGGVLMPKQAGS